MSVLTLELVRASKERLAQPALERETLLERELHSYLSV
jgi:hypothetical protein